ncbi:MAG TPA: TonB family protein [Sphingomicrobium sp.]|jgi:protein TonB
MYSANLETRYKGGAIAGVIGIHAALALALLHLSGTVDLADPQDVLSTFDVVDVPPPVELAPPPPPQPAPAEQRAKRPEGGSAPNLRSEATPIVAPQPKIDIPVTSPVATSETPAQGTAATQGAAAVAGPGTGSGGSGIGSGGGSGAGNGGDGDGGIATHPRLLSPPLRTRDFPPDARRMLSAGRSPFVTFTVEANGRVSNCRIYQSSGDEVLDNTLCALVTSRFIYQPATNRRGQAVAAKAAYRQAQ